MNAYIEKTQIFHKIKYDLNGHSMSHKMTFIFKNQRFLSYNFPAHSFITQNKFRRILPNIIKYKYGEVTRLSYFLIL